MLAMLCWQICTDTDLLLLCAHSRSCQTGIAWRISLREDEGLWLEGNLAMISAISHIVHSATPFFRMCNSVGHLLSVVTNLAHVSIVWKMSERARR